MTRKSSLSNSNRPTHNKTLATGNTLTDSELDLVGGGTRHTDVASANLFLKCANGKHFDEAVIVS